ncbi:MAG: putative sulfate exporter family transporter, partial [Litorivicinaceae bacterium]
GGSPWIAVVCDRLCPRCRINSVFPIPVAVTQLLSQLSQVCLVVAIAALGLKTSLPTLFRSGGVVMGLILLETLVLLVVVIGLTPLLL